MAAVLKPRRLQLLVCVCVCVTGRRLNLNVVIIHLLVSVVLPDQNHSAERSKPHSDFHGVCFFKETEISSSKTPNDVHRQLNTHTN